ncbi:MAG: Gfo/Idh/MocA family oxidoreductase [Muribaculaceae bacterium]|nr:Gfo/Idh/MocA family oxidoreductase [Muribaculaceae bacterium]
MIQNIINRYKRARTNAYLSHRYDSQFAFVGMGQHSLNNLYPVLNYLNVPLKYICVTSEKKAKLISRKFTGVKATTSISDILNDDTIKGVFVSTTPTAHFQIAKKVLQHGKSLFIEKPPCSSIDELNELIRLSEQYPNSVVTVGLQKRYAPCSEILKNKLNKENIISYNMRYCTGQYPEGNALTDLFIHTIDLVIYLFGESSIVACEKVSKGSYILMLKHGSIVGTLELSSDYSWDSAIETLSVCTQRGVYNLSQMEELTYIPKQRSICGIPIEKVVKRNSTIEYLFHHNNFSPIIVNNQIYTQGFYDEIKSFVDLVGNSSKGKKSFSDFSSILNTYEIITSIKNKF